MTERHFAQQQIERLSDLDWYKALEATAFRALVDVAMSARSEAVLMGVIDEWRATKTKVPKEAELRQLIQEHEDKGKYWSGEKAETPNCVLCQDTGLMGGRPGVPFAYCQCAIGERRRVEEPRVVEESNRTLELLRARFSRGAGDRK